MGTTIRILVADDHPVVRDGLVSMLNTQSDFEVVGKAASGVEVLREVSASQPEIVLLDLEMPEMDGVEVIKRLRASHPRVRVIVFTAYDTDERILGAVQAGTQGYLLKGAPREEIFRAIRVVGEGGSLLQPVVATKLIQHFSETAQAKEEQAIFRALTEREREVLQLLAQGKTNKEIAGLLVITERTVKFHVSSILSKLGVGNRTEAVRIGVQSNLIQW